MATRKAVQAASSAVDGTGSSAFAERVRNTIREVSARTRATLLASLITDLQGAIAAYEGAAAAIEAQAATALAESSAAWKANREALADAHAEAQHLAALLGVAENARAQADRESPDERLLEEWSENAAAFADARKAVAEYEALATRAAAVLARIERGQEAFRQLDTGLRRLYDSGDRDRAWLEAMFLRTIGTAEPVDPFHVQRRGALHRLVQLPALTQEEPFWGSVRGDFSLPVSERIAKQEAEMSPEQRALVSRPPGVYGATDDGPRVIPAQ